VGLEVWVGFVLSVGPYMLWLVYKKSGRRSGPVFSYSLNVVA
jgi:hypothetical protein